jgi:hypothetical protein
MPVTGAEEEEEGRGDEDLVVASSIDVVRCEMSMSLDNCSSTDEDEEEEGGGGREEGGGRGEGGVEGVE